LITLFHCVSARSFRPLWTMAEIGLGYELKMLPFPPRVHARHFLDSNPLGTVPLLIDGATRMTESAAMCQYLAERYRAPQLLVPPDDAAFGAFLNWIHFGEATLTFPQALIIRYSQLEAPERRSPQIVADYSRWFLGRLRAVETAVASRDYLCGDQFTIADISVGYALMLAEQIGLGSQLPHAVGEYWKRLSDRASYQEANISQMNAARAQGVSEQSFVPCFG
jgi:glutathione S-transferase